jgi:hypothetical protein
VCGCVGGVLVCGVCRMCGGCEGCGGCGGVGGVGVCGGVWRVWGVEGVGGVGVWARRCGVPANSLRSTFHRLHLLRLWTPTI